MMMEALLQEVGMLKAKIATAATKQDSLEWYLNNNLDDFAVAVRAGGHGLENAGRALMRFCTDSMNWDSLLYQESVALAEKGVRVAKA